MLRHMKANLLVQNVCSVEKVSITCKTQMQLSLGRFLTLCPGFPQCKLTHFEGRYQANVTSAALDTSGGAAGGMESHDIPASGRTNCQLLIKEKYTESPEHIARISSANNSAARSKPPMGQQSAGHRFCHRS